MHNSTHQHEEPRVTRTSLDLVTEFVSTDLDDAWSLCLGKLESLGVSSILYGFITSKAEVARQGMTNACHFKTNHNQEWCDFHGSEKLLDTDLTAELIMFSDSKEVVWSDESVYSECTPEERERILLENDFGMGVGASVRLEGADESSVMSGVGLSTQPISAKDFPFYWSHHRIEVLNVCHALDYAMRSVHMTNFIRLTSREKEFLTLLAGGYSQKQISELWKRSLHTLEHHSRNCRIKLKAGNLEQAVYKAFVLGLISP